MRIVKLIAKLFGKGEFGAKTFDPDERWSNLYREREKNSIYKWVGTQSGGELITVYEKEGEEGVLKFAQEKLEPMLYNEGQTTQTIKFADYVRWRKSMNVTLGITDDDEISESDSYFREHEALTRLNKRGVEGETLVHLLLARKEPMCREIARILINKYPGMAKDIYLGEEMFGQNGLHLAIVHEDYEMVNLLLEMGASVNARATGDFFMPEDYDKNSNRSKDFNGYAYYGEYPLAFAASFENKDIYDLLIQYGANPDLQDKFGNSVLHMCVIYNQNAMYSYAVRHWHKPAHSHIINYAGQTPLTLATKLGRREIFDEMLELMKVEFWRFSDMTCSVYPLEALDSIRLDGTTNFDSALLTVVNGDEAEHLDMIGSEVIQRLLEDKWKAFAQKKLFERLALLVLQLFNLSFVVYLRPISLDQLYMGKPDVMDWIRSVFELLALICCFWFLFVHQLSDLRNQGFYAYYQNIKTAPEKIVYLMANVCFVACVPARILQFDELEDTLLTFAVPFSWTFLMFFVSSTKTLGPFVQIFYEMLSRDIVRYAIILSIFLVAFAQVFYFLGKDENAIQAVSVRIGGACNTGGLLVNYDSFFDSLLTLYSLMVQGSAINLQEYYCTNNVALANLMLIIFVAIISMMMVNILIAMMERTYTEIIEHAEKAWRQQKAKLIMVFERSLDPQKLAASLLEYSIRMNERGRESRGLMVIKHTTKTRAFQRKQAINNWKMMGRKVITMVNELGTDPVRYLLHNIDQLVTEDAIGGAGRPETRYGSAAWQRAMVIRPQSSARSSLVSSNGGNLADDARTSQNPLEILQIEHDDTAEMESTFAGQLQKSISLQQLDQQNNEFGNQNIPFQQRKMIIGGVAYSKYAGNVPLQMSSNPIPDHQYLHLTQRILTPKRGSRIRGVEMLPSIDVPNIPANDQRNVAENRWENDEGMGASSSSSIRKTSQGNRNLQQKSGKKGTTTDSTILQKSASISSIHPLSSSYQKE